MAALAPEAVAEFEAALRVFADDLTTNFASMTTAQPEDQLKAPVGALVKAAGAALGITVASRTEVRVDGVGGRPDLGVDATGLPVGNIELKKPGYGARPDTFPDARSREQWERFKALPNLVYTDGQEWALYRSGELVGSPFRLSFDPTHAGAAGVATADATALLGVLSDFLGWSPVVPSSPRALATMLAPITRVLRDEVLADVQDGGVMAKLAKEWRATLFPDADDKTFADGYAQTFTYALLLARLEGAQPPLTAETAADELENDHALLSQALLLLGQKKAREAIGMPVGLLERVIGAVDAAKLAKGRDPWLYFYEDFLAAYDPAQRNNRGVYYTPFEVVNCQVRLADWLLNERLEVVGGFGNNEVVVLDPAAGTGTYPLSVVAHAVKQAEPLGAGIVAEVATQLGRNLNAFELLVGPYAVTHLRLSRALTDAGGDLPESGVSVFLTDTLTAPTHEGFASQVSLFQQTLAEEQERASKVKSTETKVTVVIGNPPYDRDEAQTGKGVRRKGGMVRYADTGDGPGLIKDFLDPLVASGGGVHAKNLYNDYVYFWRWAIWKVCEQNDDPGIVSFITASSYLDGPGYAGMREVMRRRFDELWLIDLGGEGRGTRKEENVFNILSPVVIGIGVRLPGVDPETRADTPAVVRYRKVTGSRDEKLKALDSILELEDLSDWSAVSDAWLDNFTPAGAADFHTWPTLADLFPWQHSGSQFKRSWPISESSEVLAKRWQALMLSPVDERGPLLRETRDRKATGSYPDIRTGARLTPIAEWTPTDTAPVAVRYAYRSFDRQWCLPDGRVGDFLRPPLWRSMSDHQLFLVTLPKPPLGAGPAVSVSAFVPDNDCYRGSYSGSVFPLFRDKGKGAPNVTSALLALLEASYEAEVTPEDLFAYSYGVLGTGAYSEKYSDFLLNSMPRIPFTSDAALFREVVALGRDLLWWATFGERCQPVDAKGKPVKVLPAGIAKNTKPVPATPDKYPTEFSYDPATLTLTVGEGKFTPVAPEVWEFEVSGLKVVQSWLAYRMKKRAGKASSELDNIRPDKWTFSRELLEVLAVVEHIVARTPDAADLLDRVVSGDLIDPSLFPKPTAAEQAAPKDDAAKKPENQLGLFG